MNKADDNEKWCRASSGASEKSDCNDDLYETKEYPHINLPAPHENQPTWEIPVTVRASNVLTELTRRSGIAAR